MSALPRRTASPVSPQPGLLARIFREPLAHFLLLAAAIFAVHLWLNSRRPTELSGTHAILVDAGQVEKLNQLWHRQWKRPPTEAELRSMVEDFIQEEILYREALSLGLDRDDTIIRRRLAQKMQFLSEDLMEMEELRESELREYFLANQERYREPARLDFEHIYFGTRQRGAGAQAEARAGLDMLRQEPEAPVSAAMGDAFLLGTTFTAVTPEAAASQFGGEFGNALERIPAGSWKGPLKSSYGWHLVRVSRREEGPVPELAAVREEVRRDLQQARRVKFNNGVLAGLKVRYRIEVDEEAIKNAFRPGLAQEQP